MRSDLVPEFLKMPATQSQCPMPKLAERVGGIAGDGAPTAELVRECAEWVDGDFDLACPTLLERLAPTQQNPAQEKHVGRRDRASILLYAALVGLARGASRDAFSYAGARKLKGRSLLELELLSARLSAIATAEAISDLQLGYLCHLGGAWNGDRGRGIAQAEIRRASLDAVAESAHVHGGHGFIKSEAPGRRVEMAHIVLSSLGGKS